MQITVVGIRFKENGKVYFFDPKDLQLNIGDGALVETARGLEYGTVASHIKQVDQAMIISELKPVVRKATEKDIKQYNNNIQKSQEAQKVILQMIDNLKLDMQVVDVEYVFDGSKVIISFTSDNRVDFRELVKDLAIKLKTRIELRQIGIRDKSKVVGGIGICGKECCCKTYLNDFEKVSIKMAKTQGLSLNPTKISGLCGRLMCCLEYENPYYAEVASKMPKINSEVTTPDGKGVVVYQNYLRQKVSVKLEGSDAAYNYKEYDLDQLKTTKTVKGSPAPVDTQPKQDKQPAKQNQPEQKVQPQEQKENTNTQKNKSFNKNKKHKKFNKKGKDEKQSNPQ